MNPVLSAGAETARLGEWMGWTTAFFLVVMVGWSAWAWWPSARRREALDAAARLPLEGGEP